MQVIMNVLFWFGVYLIIGGAVIVALNALTGGRIFRNFTESVYEGQDVLFSHGLPMNTEMVKVVMIATVWLFWPALVFGSVEKWIKGRKKENI